VISALRIPHGPSETRFPNNVAHTCKHSGWLVRLGLSRWRGGRFAYTSLIRRWSLERLTVARYDDVNMDSDVSCISMSINNGLLTQLLSIQQLPTQSRFKSHSSTRPPQTPRLPPNLLIENARIEIPLHAKVCPEAFPIKASGYSEVIAAGKSRRSPGVGPRAQSGCAL